MRAFFEQRLAAAAPPASRANAIAFDPGIGFGKTVEHNLTLLRELDSLRSATARSCWASRARPSWQGYRRGNPAERLWPTVALTALLRERGARVLRVHDVRPNVAALRIAEALLAAAMNRHAPLPRTIPGSMCHPFPIHRQEWNSGMEILLLAVGIYYGYLYFRGTRGARVLTGLALFLVTLTLLSEALNLVVIRWLIGGTRFSWPWRWWSSSSRNCGARFAELGSRSFFAGGKTGRADARPALRVRVRTGRPSIMAR